MKRIVLSCLLLLGIVLYFVHKDKVKMAELQQSPEIAQNASFLHPDSTLKVVQNGTLSLPLTTATNTYTTNSVTLTHNLGYVPVYSAYLSFPSSPGQFVNADSFIITRDFTISAANTSTIQAQSRIVVTSTTLTWYWFDQTSTYNGQTLTLKYYLMQEQAH